ncbi:hypothetical protein WA026_023649 [Henosepilachna vigintioctopunctata]|uniref:Uncharacterized protein n=1 Tax=Henosepilachna vigintioctopunctata TaxID=420089 RepID=A0AAW1VJR8_9CUCU
MTWKIIDEEVGRKKWGARGDLPSAENRNKFFTTVAGSIIENIPETRNVSSRYLKIKGNNHFRFRYNRQAASEINSFSEASSLVLPILPTRYMFGKVCMPEEMEIV